jgi:hypothetical protein
MSSTQTYYFKPLADIYPYAFRDPILKKFVYYNIDKLRFWEHEGIQLIAKNYPLRKSPISQLTDTAYTGFYYREIEFKKRDPKINYYDSMGSD